VARAVIKVKRPSALYGTWQKDTLNLKDQVRYSVLGKRTSKNSKCAIRHLAKGYSIWKRKVPVSGKKTKCNEWQVKRIRIPLSILFPFNPL